MLNMSLLYPINPPTLLIHGVHVPVIDEREINGHTSQTVSCESTSG